MNQKGLIPILVLIGLVVLSGTAVAGIIYVSKTIPDFTVLNKQSREFTASSSTLRHSSDSQALPQSPSAKRLSAFEILLGRNRVTQPPLAPSPPASAKISIPTPSPSVSVVTTVAPTATPAPTVRKNTCDVNVTYGKLDPSQISGPGLVTLSYSFTGYNNVYMTGAQWDFDGEGIWDTDMSQSNGIIEHTFGSSGTYNVKLRVKASDGSVTEVCSKSVTINIPNDAMPTPTPRLGVKVTAKSCLEVTVEGEVTYRSQHIDQDGYLVRIYNIQSGGKAKLTANTNPTGAYIRWEFGAVSSLLPNGGTLTPDNNNYSVVNFTAPNNPTSEAQGTYVRGVYSEGNPSKYCPLIDFAVQ